MSYNRFNSIPAKTACLLSFISFATVGVTTTTTRKVEATRPNAATFPVQASSTTGPSKGNVNGKIVFASDRQTGGTGFRLWTMNSDGSNPLRLTEIPSGPNPPSYVYDDSAKWSPDGAKIAFLSIGRSNLDSRSIYVMNADGSDLRQIVIDWTGMVGELGGFEWSPDGTRFLFAAGIYITIDSVGTSNIFVANVDGKSVVRLTNDNQVMNGSAKWSPDGRLIAFGSWAPGKGYSIDLMNADGSSRHTIANGYSPTWSPDGSKILFVAVGQYLSCYNYICDQLYIINPDGRQLTQLTHYAGSYTSPKYSPDGAKILFERHLETYYETHDFPFGARFSSDDGYAVFVMNADGSNQTNISNHRANLANDDFGYNVGPDWQPLSAPASDPLPSILGLSSDLYLAPTIAPVNTVITVTRSGNLNQAVSCDYNILWNGNVLGGLPQGTLNFAPGETSKVIEFNESYINTDDTWYVHLFNNAGDATLVGGTKDALITLPMSSAIDNTDFFVRQQYEDFLNRDPDEAGWRFWNISLYTCGTRGAGAACYQSRRPEVSAAFFLSTEFQETGYLVYRVYKAAYGNVLSGPVPIRFAEFLPDTREIGHGVIVNEGNWQQQLETNKQAFLSEFVQRSRFTIAYPTFMTPVQFVDSLFANAGVVPTALEREAAIFEFNGAASSADNAARARALRRVAENQTFAQQEFNRAFVLMQYFGYLRRDPNSGRDANWDGYNFWLNKLNQFNGDYNKAEMVKAFIGADEYRKRFGQ